MSAALARAGRRETDAGSTRLRPFDLARYKALSAARITGSVFGIVRAEVATPMLTVTDRGEELLPAASRRMARPVWAHPRLVGLRRSGPRGIWRRSAMRVRNMH